MSLLQNPSFEGDEQPWAPVNLASSVTFGILSDPSIARSGSSVLYFRTTQASGSMAQDITIQGPSVSAFAWIRAAGAGPVTGNFALWQLNADPGPQAQDCRFTAGPEWQLITNTMRLVRPPQVPSSNVPPRVRVEFYLQSVNADLYVDSVNAW